MRKSNESGTKAVKPRDDTAPHGMETPTHGGPLAGVNQGSGTRRIYDPIPGSGSLPKICYSNESWTKTVVPLDGTPPHVVEISTPLTPMLAGVREASKKVQQVH